jgi:hypothetical protein
MVNVVEIHTHAWKWKNETIPGMGEGGLKENDGRDEFNYDIL